MSNLIQTLTQQLEKLRKHNRQGSIKTKERYFQAMQRFCKYLAETWRLQKLANIAPKHLEAYAEHMKKTNKSASTIKTDLAAIRFYHDLISNPRHKLPDNSELNLQRRKFIGFNRAWSQQEFNLMLGIATELLREDYVCAMCLAYYAGLRIHECCRLDTATVENAIKTGVLTVKGKNGKIRSVPIDELLKIILQKRLQAVERGSKLLVSNNTPTHIYIKQLQHFINHHRDKLPPCEGKERLTFHGLRHAYAQRGYSELINTGKQPWEAEQAVSKLLGHERGHVTRIYLSGGGGK
ncbi:MAG: tyrosine-type recombinase/integrase [Oscillospiraceae bacterium]|nr:tyrosine-type recombinase/integrase [Oscillospiraceae bacterium]